MYINKIFKLTILPLLVAFIFTGANSAFAKGIKGGHKTVKAFKHHKKAHKRAHKKAYKNKINQKFKCGVKRYCKEMTSCKEAKFYLNVCGVKRLDRDKDGIPCENLCK